MSTGHPLVQITNGKTHHMVSSCKQEKCDILCSIYFFLYILKHYQCNDIMNIKIKLRVKNHIFLWLYESINLGFGFLFQSFELINIFSVILEFFSQS